MNNPETKLKDLIHIEKNIIPSDICDFIVKDLETRQWKPHGWYNTNTGQIESEKTMELEVQSTTEELQKILNPFMVESAKKYNSKYSFDCEKTKQIVFKFCPIRFNRYSKGQIMRQHHDHIHSIFDGQNKGIPVLSFIGNLNDNYKGAELVFWENYSTPLGKGDIIIFPSLFLFPHKVNESTEGKRYSFVSWGW